MTTEDIVAIEAAVIVEDAFINDFAELHAGNTPGRAAEHGSDEHAEESSCQHAWRSRDDADRHADAST